MTLYDELVARGLIAQVTDETEIKELINNGKATFYIGFDPTADSLHVGRWRIHGQWRRGDRGQRKTFYRTYTIRDDPHKARSPQDGYRQAR